MEPVIRKLKIQAIREQLALCLQTLESIDKELQIAPLTEEDRSALTRRSDDMLRESNVLQLTLDLLERQEREEHERGAATQG